MSTARKKLRISGMVQGVGFRYFVYRNAGRLHVKGYVRNTPDGAVEVLAEGEKDAVENMENLCRKGPAGARVERVNAEEQEFLGEYDVFEIRL